MIPGDDEVRVDINAAVMTITLDRPKANAIDLPTSRKLGEALVYFRDNPDLKVAIITGAGEKIFCAGWDLKALDSGDTPAGKLVGSRRPGTRRLRRHYRNVEPEQARDCRIERAHYRRWF